MVDTTTSAITIITISTDLSIKITRSALRTQVIEVTKAVIFLEDVVKASISTMTNAIVAIRTNLVAWPIRKKVARR